MNFLFINVLLNNYIKSESLLWTEDALKYMVQ